MSTEPQLTGKPLRVLLVEDSADDALILERHLRRAGFDPDVTRVETAEEMRSALESGAEDWDVVLADYNLPTFSAPEALQLLKSTQYHIPFIMMSGAISDETAVEALRAGAHDYISKQNLARLIPAIEREIAEAIIRRHKRAAERALRVSEERFHRLVEAMPLALLISDMSGRITYANEGVERLLKFRRGEMLDGAVTLDRVFPVAGNTAQSLLDQLSKANGETYEVECLTSDGVSVPVLIGAARLNAEAPPDDGQVAAFLVDLTEQKRSQDILRRTEKLAAAGRLAASIAHEINNPLEAVTNCMYLLQQGTMDSQSRIYLDLAAKELDRVSQITTQTLRFYRQSTRPVNTDIHELFETVLALYDMRLRAHNVEVTRQYGNIPRILANDGEVRQVLANLVGNALDAMQESGGRLLLRTRRVRNPQTGGEGISILVADTGTGIDSATRDRLFEPFFSTKGITGTGLGLWVSREILAKHQGTIRVRSRQQHPTGTFFRVFLPLDRFPSEQHEPQLLSANA